MYIMTSTGGVMALNATNGDLLWEYTRPQPPAPAAPAPAQRAVGGVQPQRGGRGAAPRVYNSRSKTFSIFDDLIFYTAPDSQVVGLDARTGELRWQSKVDSRGNSSGTIMAGDKVIRRLRLRTRASCYISAHDAHTGKELWKFYTRPTGSRWRQWTICRTSGV
jgi:alcohol dehydrogenase (cytochrome c)